MRQSGNTSRTITRRLLIVTIAGTIFTSATVALAAAAPLYFKLKDELARHLSFSAQREADAIASVIEGQKRIASQIASRSHARENLDLYNDGKITLEQLRPTIRPILNDALNQSIAIISITRHDRAGNPVLTVGDRHADATLDRDALLADGVAFHGVQKINGHPCALVSAPILDRAGRRVGTDAILFSAEEFQDFTAPHTGDASAREYIGAADAARPIFEPGNATRNDEIAELCRRAAAGESGVSNITTASGAAIAAFHPVEGADWGVVILRSTDAYFASLRRDTAAVGLIALAFCLAASTLVLIVVRPLAGSFILHAEELEATIDDRTTSLRESQRQTERINTLLVSASRDLRVFTGTISHDFRTPIVTISCNAGILREIAESSDNQDALRACHAISNACENVDTALKGLNTLTRSATAERATERVDLGAVFERVRMELLEDPRHANKNIHIQHPLPAALTDPDWTHRIAHELLSNALIHGCPKRRGTVTVHADTEGDHPRVHITDHGPGIDEKYHDKVFDPFESLQRSHSSPGIGLAICKRAITLLEGSITLTTTPGGGATFTIQLPRADPTESQAAA